MHSEKTRSIKIEALGAVGTASIFSRQAALRSTSLAAMPFCHLRLVEIKPKNHSYLWKSDLYPLILIGICFLARHVLGAARVSLPLLLLVIQEIVSHPVHIIQIHDW